MSWGHAFGCSLVRRQTRKVFFCSSQRHSEPQTTENRGRETGEEFGRRYAQTACKLQHYRETRDFISSFHLADVGCCHPGFFGKVLLGPPVLIPQPSYGAAQNLAFPVSGHP